MQNESISWKIDKSEPIRKLVSDDERWHATLDRPATEEPTIFLINYDLLLAPSGTGASLTECFERFVESCDAYAEKLARVRAMAVRELAARREEAEPDKKSANERD